MARQGPLRSHVDISLVWIDPLITLALTLLRISISEGNSAKSEGHTPKFCNDAMVATQSFPTLHEHHQYPGFGKPLIRILRPSYPFMVGLNPSAL